MPETQPASLPGANQIHTMLQTMAAMQDSHNTQVAADWRQRGFAYYRAIWVECAELLDHYGWKWWKAQQPDLDQVKLELVDIWHFGLSILLREERMAAGLAEEIHNGLKADPAAEGFRATVEQLATETLTSRTFSVPAFLACMVSLSMGFRELHELYVGKNVLNSFRQDHGYKDGSYQKVWAGLEDNEHLIQVLAALDPAAADYASLVYAGLEQRYPG